MNHIFKFSALGLASLLLIACSQNNGSAPLKESELEQSTSTSEQSKSLPTRMNSTETNLNWVGEYEGVFPCADCEGIQIELQLNADKTYELNQEYLGTKAKNEFEVKGSFSFDAQNPSIISLDDKAENRKFLVGENFLEARELESGNKIDSNLNYKLMKQPE